MATDAPSLEIAPTREQLQIACSPLERRFCELFVEFDGDRIKAVVKTGYSEKSAKTQAWHLLKRRQVQQYIEFLTIEKEKRERVNLNWVLDNLYNEATDLNIKGTTQASRVRATELIAKIKGYLDPDDKKQSIVPITVYVGINLDDI